MNIHVTTIDELYAAINNATNAGKKIIIAPGEYLLDTNSRPNAGRLELLEDMSLTGQTGDATRVTIDASKLPNTSFNPPLNFPARRTGAIRMGKGSNTIEWVKIIGNDNKQPLSVIDTDLIGEGVAEVRIANTIISGGRIGINIRNAGPASVGRVIKAEIEGNELTGNLVSDIGTQQGQGIVMQNANGASNATINVTMKDNNIHGNIIGMRVFNYNGNPNTHSDNSKINIQSNNDRFDENKLGIHIVAGSNAITGTNSTVNGNLVSFEAHKSSIQNNHGIVPDAIMHPCGIHLIGGSNSLAGSQSSNNRLEMKLKDCIISGNDGSDVIAFGAFSTTATLAGTNNRVEIEMTGKSKKTTIVATPSSPLELAGTNIINIHK